MQLSKILKVNFAQKFFFSTVLQTSLSKNPVRDAIRFENQNRLWTFEELEVNEKIIRIEKKLLEKQEIIDWI